jgi:hypothetical protein
MKKGVAEILGEISKISSKKTRVEELRKNENTTIKTVLQGAFDPRVEWLLPKGVPPYKKNDLTDLESVFYAEARKLYLFVKGGNDSLQPLRREALFIEMLENLAPADAELLCSIKDKKLPFKGITPSIVREAFPGLLPDEQK